MIESFLEWLIGPHYELTLTIIFAIFYIIISANILVYGHPFGSLGE